MSEIAVTFKEAKAEVGREIAMRSNVYRKWIEKGSMDKKEAELRIARLRAVADLLNELNDNTPVDQLLRLRTIVVQL
jgi:hypothetical protein